MRLTCTFFDSGQILMRLSIAPPPMREEWRPTLQRVTMSGGESRVVAVRPSPTGEVPSRSVASMAAAAAEVMAAILAPMVEARLEVTLAIPPAPATAEETGEMGLPTLLGGGTRSSPSWSELLTSGGDMARPKAKQQPAGRGVKEVEIPCPGEVGT